MTGRELRALVPQPLQTGWGCGGGAVGMRFVVARVPAAPTGEGRRVVRTWVAALWIAVAGLVAYLIAIAPEPGIFRVMWRWMQ